MGKILHLTLHRKWFKEILEGKKEKEYREKKPFWTKRLLDEKGTPKNYDFIRFRNGYSRDAPSMDIEFKGITILDKYEIHLGKVISKSNIEQLRI